MKVAPGPKPRSRRIEGRSIFDEPPRPYGSVVARVSGFAGQSYQNVSRETFWYDWGANLRSQARRLIFWAKSFGRFDKSRLGATCHAHPTLSEAVREAALAADERTIHI
jgi:hypothetical protein